MPAIAPVSHSTTGCQRSSSSSRASARRSALSRACLRPASRAGARRVHVPGVAPARPRPQHRDARALQQRLGVRPVLRKEGDPDAGRHRELVAADAEGVAQGEAQLLGDHDHVGVALDPGQQEREHVVLPEPRERVGLAQRALEGERHAAQEVVAMAGAEGLRDPARPVDPELRDREPWLAALRVRDRDGEPVVEAARPREPRERVVLGEIGDLVLQALALRALLGREPPRAAQRSRAAPGPPPPAAARGPTRRRRVRRPRLVCFLGRRASAAGVGSPRPGLGDRGTGSTVRRRRSGTSRRAASRPSSPTNDCQRLFHSAMWTLARRHDSRGAR